MSTMIWSDYTVGTKVIRERIVACPVCQQPSILACTTQGKGGKVLRIYAHESKTTAMFRHITKHCTTVTEE